MNPIPTRTPAPSGAPVRPRLRRRSRLRQAGFTFLELMVVIAIIAIATALVVANMDGLMSSSQLSQAAREMGNWLQDAQSTAALQAREIPIEIDFEKRQWRLIDRPSPNEIPDERVREEETMIHEFDLDLGIVMDEIAFGPNEVHKSGVVEISFDSNGEVSPGSFVVYFRHEELGEDEGISVELTSLTGLVSFHHGRIESEGVLDEDDF